MNWVGNINKFGITSFLLHHHKSTPRGAQREVSPGRSQLALRNAQSYWTGWAPQRYEDMGFFSSRKVENSDSYQVAMGVGGSGDERSSVVQVIRSRFVSLFLFICRIELIWTPSSHHLLCLFHTSWCFVIFNWHDNTFVVRLERQRARRSTSFISYRRICCSSPFYTCSRPIKSPVHTETSCPSSYTSQT